MGREQEIEHLHQCLVQKLDQPERSILLSLLDAQNEWKNEISVASFVAGFRLAGGVAKELAGEQYSFDEDEVRWLRRKGKEA